eukprot:1420750-Pleurochrysis_carterae.AAC.3
MQRVHAGRRAHGLVIVVEAHVEGLAVLGVVVDDERLLAVRLREVALVLRLQLLAPPAATQRLAELNKSAHPQEGGLRPTPCGVAITP